MEIGIRQSPRARQTRRVLARRQRTGSQIALFTDGLREAQ